MNKIKIRACWLFNCSPCDSETGSFQVVGITQKLNGGLPASPRLIFKNETL
jgi:hypothetical protein